MDVIYLSNCFTRGFIVTTDVPILYIGIGGKPYFDQNGFVCEGSREQLEIILRIRDFPNQGYIFKLDLVDEQWKISHKFPPNSIRYNGDLLLNGYH